MAQKTDKKLIEVILSNLNQQKLDSVYNFFDILKEEFNQTEKTVENTIFLFPNKK